MQHSSWHAWLRSTTEGYFGKINQFMEQVYAQGTAYPPKESFFKLSWLLIWKSVGYGDSRAKTPYHGPGQAQDLSFSGPRLSSQLRRPCKISWKNCWMIIGAKKSHDLTVRAEQGVLLLNACLTVPAGQANGHSGLIWEPFYWCCGIPGGQ